MSAIVSIIIYRIFFNGKSITYLFMIFGALFLSILLLPVILLGIGFYIIYNQLNPKPKRKFTYRSYSSQSFNDFFEEMFKQQNNYQNYRGYNSYENSYEIDKSKYYKVLNVPEDASMEEIKKAYRNLAKQHHPDRYVNESDEVRAEHERKFKEINEAYEALQK